MIRLIFRSTVEKYKKIGSGIFPLETSGRVSGTRRLEGISLIETQDGGMDSLGFMVYPRRASCPGPVCKEMRVPNVPLLSEWPESVIGKFLHIDILSLQFSEVEPRETKSTFGRLNLGFSLLTTSA